MNYNDIIAQQQALLQNAQRWQFAYVAISLAMFILSGWVLYMFYARLRDIADELRKFRIAYEFAHERQANHQGILPERSRMIRATCPSSEPAALEEVEEEIPRLKPP